MYTQPYIRPSRVAQVQDIGNTWGALAVCGPYAAARNKTYGKRDWNLRSRRRDARTSGRCAGSMKSAREWATNGRSVSWSKGRGSRQKRAGVRKAAPTNSGSRRCAVWCSCDIGIRRGGRAHLRACARASAERVSAGNSAARKWPGRAMRFGRWTSRAGGTMPRGAASR